MLIAGGFFYDAELFLPLPPTVFLVTNTQNAGAGSLRQAILNANAHPGLDAIFFDIPGAGVHTISPVSQQLPNIQDPVILDAATQPGYAGTPLIELNGSGAGSAAAGILINSGSSTVRGLAINRFGSQPGISLTAVGATAWRATSSARIPPVHSPWQTAQESR